MLLEILVVLSICEAVILVERLREFAVPRLVAVFVGLADRQLWVLRIEVGIGGARVVGDTPWKMNLGGALILLGGLLLK